MDPAEELARLLAEEVEQRKYNRLAYMYPSEGEFARDKYPKHMETIAASARFHELAFFGGNGTGKSMLGAYMTSVLATGRYPEWWSGYSVMRPIRAWVSGTSYRELRTSLQRYLFGDVAERGVSAFGEGLIPREDIVDHQFIKNGNGVLDYVVVRNRAGEGGESIIRVKSYDQGPESYQADNLDWAWEDEEPPGKIHSETMMRFRGVDHREGRCFTSCTPLKGQTEFFRSMQNWRDANAKEGASRFAIFVGMREVPHLTEAEIQRKLAAALPNERKARETGIAFSGTGLVYPVEESKFVVRPVRLEPHWRRGFAFDYGPHNTAFVYFAVDDDTDTVYAYKDYLDGDKPIAVHAAAMRGQGLWIPGVGDASAPDSDGKAIVEKYKQQGIPMVLAVKGSVQVGCEAVFDRLETGRLKVFSTCSGIIEEIRSYSFDENGKIVKKNDHRLDCVRYFISGGGIGRAITERRTQTYDYHEPSFG